MVSDFLNSWKEIASYVGRGLRTVQRWEQELGFPVRRPRGKSRSAVMAFKGEIDLWLRTHQGPAQRPTFRDKTGMVQQRAAAARRRSERLKKQVAADRAKRAASLKLLRQRLDHINALATKVGSFLVTQTKPADKKAYNG